MMETIKPPTDSLYKFLALFGLGLFVASLTAPFWIYNKIGEQWIEVGRDSKILEADAEDWRQAGREMDRAKTRFDQSWERLTEAMDKFMKSKLSKPELERAFKEGAKARQDVYDNVKTVRQRVAEWDKKHAQLQYKRDLIDNNEANARMISIMSLVGATTGLLSSIAGFLLWYKRAQRYEDVVLRKKAEENEPNSE